MLKMECLQEFSSLKLCNAWPLHYIVMSMGHPVYPTSLYEKAPQTFYRENWTHEHPGAFHPALLWAEWDFFFFFLTLLEVTLVCYSCFSRKTCSTVIPASLRNKDSSETSLLTNFDRVRSWVRMSEHIMQLFFFFFLQKSCYYSKYLWN